MIEEQTRRPPPKNPPKRPAVVEVMPGEITLEPIVLSGQKINLNHYFSNEYTSIEQASQELPPLIEWVNAQLQLCYEDKLNFKTELEETEARVFLDLRGEDFTAKYGGKPTVDAVKAAVLLDDDVQDLRRKFNVAAAWVRRLDNLQNSLQTKLDLTRSSEATRRDLLSGERSDGEEPRNRRRGGNSDEEKE